MGPSPNPSGYRFGAFELDLRTRELRRRGILVRLRGRPIEFLAALLERPSELVTREELRTRLWPADTFVDFDHGLNSAVNKLREALGDTADNPRFIETVPKRGYRWVGPIERLEPMAEAPASAAIPAVPRMTAGLPVELPPPAGSEARGYVARAWPLLAVGVAIVASLTWWLSSRQPVAGVVEGERRVMLVVLPFQNLGQPGDDDVFTDGITDEMIGQLGALDPQRLGVIARTSSMQYKRTTKSVTEIGKELTVDYLLEGSVRRDANRARITAHLVDVATQTQLWSETYERDLDDVLMLQRDVATRISRSLAGGVLSPVLARQGQSPQFEAYELVLKARSLRQDATEESAWQCVATFEEALRRAPDYAPAHAGLGDCYRLLGAPGWEAGPPADLLNRARQAVDRALVLDPNLPDAYATRSMVRFNLDWDLTGATDDIDRAVALNPSLARAHQYRSAILTARGQFDEAVRAAELARHLDPLSVTESTTLGIRLYYAGRYPEAIQQLTQTSLLNPRFAVLSWALGEVYREMGKFPEALAHLRVAVELSNDSAYMRAWLAHALGAAGMKDEAERIRRDVEGLAAQKYVSPFLFALIASGAGDRDATLSWLQKAMDARSGWMPFIAVEPQFQWLRNDPAFQQLVSRVHR